LKLLFIVTEDWYFVSHRLPLALAAKAAGFEVVVATRFSKYREKLEMLGLRTVQLVEMKRSSANPWTELKALGEIRRIIHDERPSIVHAVAIKPLLYSSIVRRIGPSFKLVGALGGLGSVFSDTHGKARIFKLLITTLFRLLLDRSGITIIVQNREDQTVMTVGCRLAQKRVILIPGAGVDIDQFPIETFPEGPPVVMLASRMIWPKGLQEFTDAAAMLKGAGRDARFVLVGKPDPENLDSVSESTLQEWHSSGVVEWWGHRDDIAKTLAFASIVCLPTYYREGVPKILLEAMAAGRPIITTDMPGCRELVESGSTGLLIIPRSAKALADAVKTLLDDPEKMAEMGRRGRELAASEYSSGRVISQTLAIYSQ
jgi:glycosyltransferase involved in cell wall biosynthesis